jgi:hypothetical protein
MRSALEVADVFRRHGAAVRIHGALRARRGLANLRQIRSMLPYRERLIHVRWSGEASWIPLGNLDLGLGCENTTSCRRTGTSHGRRPYAAFMGMT